MSLRRLCHEGETSLSFIWQWHGSQLSSDHLALSDVVVPELGLLNLALVGAQQISLPEAGHATHRDKWQCWAGQAGPNWVNQYPCCKVACHAALRKDMTFPLSKSCL